MRVCADFDDGDDEDDEGENIMGDGSGDFHSFAEDNGAPIPDEDSRWYSHHYENWYNAEGEGEHPDSEHDNGSDSVDSWQPHDNFNRSLAACLDVFVNCKDKPSAMRAAMDVASALWVQEKSYGGLTKRVKKLFLSWHPDKNRGREGVCSVLFDALHTINRRILELQRVGSQ